MTSRIPLSLALAIAAVTAGALASVALHTCETDAAGSEWSERTRFVTSRVFYLHAGPQTTMSEHWRLPEELRKGMTQREATDAVLRYVRRLRHDDSDKDQLFRRRTAEQILASGFATGCTDYALAALPLLRAKGVSAVYVEAFRKDWLDDEAPFGGHVFVEAFVNGRWIILNPAAGVEAPRYDEHVVIARGADSWDIGLRNAADVDAVARLALERHRRDR